MNFKIALYEALNIILFEIPKRSENKSEQDKLAFLSLLYIALNFTALLVCLFSKLLPHVFGIPIFELILYFFSKDFINRLISSPSIELLIDTNNKLEEALKAPWIDSSLYWAFFYLIIYLIIETVIFKVFKKNMKKAFIIGSIFSILFLAYISNINWILISLCVPLLYLLFPSGNGRYMYIVQVLLCIVSEKDEDNKNQGEYRKWKRVLIFIFAWLVSIGISNWINLPLNTSLLMISAICLAVFSRKNEGNRIQGIKKMLVLYLIFFVIVLYTSLPIENEVGKYLTFILALFFAVDRILGLWKDAQDTVLESNPLYFYYIEKVPNEKLFNELIDLKYLEYVNEKALARQMFIRKRLGLEKEYLVCKEIYIQRGYNLYLEYMQ